MHYKWIMIGLIMFFLIGTISWAMPTPRQRAQAKIRKLAQAKGVQVKVGKLQPPRSRGETQVSGHLAVSYGLIRTRDQHTRELGNKSLGKGSSQCAPNTMAWEIHRLNGVRNDGLPRGWCWQTDNNQKIIVDKKKQLALSNLIEQLPEDVYAIASSSFDVRVYWHEQTTPAELDQLIEQLQHMLALSV